MFFDDILIYSSSWEDHLQHVKFVLDILRSHNLFLKREKCQFGQTQIKYLGHLIDVEGVSVDPQKVATVMEWPKPKTPKALRGFLGLTGYYRKFIHDYGKIASPLTNMLKKDSFTWTSALERAFQDLKEAMTQAPVLALPNFTNAFVVECDASGSGVGGILMQERRPIAFFSQALQGRNLLLSTYEKEMLALVLAVQKWRPYLLGRTFIVKTDHRSLKFLWEQRITTYAQQKWLSKLMGYDFQVEYRKGVENVVANALSIKEEKVELAAISTPIPRWLDTIKEEVLTNSKLQHLVKLVQEGEVVGPWEFKEGVLFFKSGIYLNSDSPLLPVIIQEFYSSTHEGMHKTLQRI